MTLTTLGIPKSKWPLISFPTDLLLIFSEYMYVGFSASTGLLTASHNVLGWSFEVGGKKDDYLDPSKLPPTDAPHHKVVNSKGFADGISLACISLVSLVMLGMYQVAKRMRRGDDEMLEEWEVEYGARRFDKSELSTATKGFSDQNLIGCCGFGRVYRGVLSSTGLEVAIKRVAHNSKQGMREFIAEITSVGRLRHQNLVQLHGWCRQKGELLLVYDHVPNGSLDKLLFNNNNNSNNNPPKKILSW